MQSDLEVADVFRDGANRFLSQYGRRHSREQHQVFRAITRCRTAELGGQMQFCHDCGFIGVPFGRIIASQKHASRIPRAQIGMIDTTDTPPAMQPPA